MEPIHLRNCKPDDARAVTGVLRDTFRSTWRPHLTADDVRQFEIEDRPSDYFGARGRHFWVAERGGDVLGFVDWDGEFVNALHIHSSAARSGIGNALMDHAEAEIAGSGHNSVKLETHSFNARSRAFYTKRGFVEQDAYPDTEWNSGLTTLLLVKPLL